MPLNGLNEFFSIQWLWYDIKTGISSIICLFFDSKGDFQKGTEYLVGRKNTRFQKKTRQSIQWTPEYTFKMKISK